MKIALIPARKGSKRLKGKNMVDFMGKPLVQWTIECAVESKVFDEVIVSTDWRKLIDDVSELFPDVSFRLRPKRLATDGSTTQEVILYDLKQYGNENEFCLLQPSNPLRSISIVKKSLELFTEDYNSLFSINPYTSKPNGIIYWFRDCEDMWKKLSKVIITKEVDIDYEYDLRIAEYIHKNGRDFEVLE